MHNVLFTVGHSAHPLEQFLVLLKRHDISAVADVRSRPYSRLNPQYNRKSLCATLNMAGIAYVFLGRELGGRPDDRSCYIDGRVQYNLLAKTELFHEGLARVVQGMKSLRVALMCAEKDPLTCHRTILVCRHLIKRNSVTVQHILEDGTLEDHDNALTRLFTELGLLPERELFHNHAELVEEAYTRRGIQIAYTEKCFSFTEHSHGVKSLRLSQSDSPY